MTITWKEGQPLQAQRQGPSDEEIDAFVLTIRFFVQDNESISFSKMGELYGQLPISADLNQKFDYARSETNADLDKATPFNVDGFVITFRYVFEVFLWGGLAHANAKKKVVYDSWAQNAILFPLLQNEFIRALAMILNMVFYTRALNKAALGEMSPTIRGSSSTQAPDEGGQPLRQ